MTSVVVEQFDGDLAELVSITDSSVEAMERFDEWHGGSPRWVARRGARVVAVLTAWRRPDERVFVRLSGLESTWAALCDAALEPLGGQLHSTASGEHLPASFASCGFRVDSISDVFEIPFSVIGERLSSTVEPKGLSFVTADEVARDRLFALDIELRNDVPGTDGWRGNRAWFDDELADRPPYDPAGYVVAVESATGSLVGLARFWRNPERPRLGLIGVLPRWRRTRLTASLLRRASDGAATWGAESFATETSRANRAVHPHLLRMGVDRTGSIMILVRP